MIQKNYLEREYRYNIANEFTFNIEELINA